LRTLADEGLIGANGLVPMPLVPLRIALITSHGSAAHADFDEQIAACRYSFAIQVLTTRVQGEFASDEIAEMIIRGAGLDIDVIAVVRGGGARTDLAAFDTEPVARAIASSPVPVLCGIGHETDSSVADVVAHTSLKTPTACAQYLIDCVAEFDAGLTERARLVAHRGTALAPRRTADLDQRVSRLGRTIALALATASRANAGAAAGLERRVVRTISRSDQRLTTVRSRLDSAAAHAVGRAEQRCERLHDRLVERPVRLLADQRQHLDLFEAKLSAVDPVQALRRGYSITTTADGKLVRSVAALVAGSPIVTRLADGTVASSVTQTRPAPSEESP
jgi:exodeoxyribonuclease VII large subunit